MKQEEAFYQMLLDDDDEEEQEACRWQISDEEYAGWQKEIRQIKVSAEVLSCITEIRKNLEKVEIQGSEVHRNVYVSDRRWKNIVKLLKASAFIHGRKEVCLTDLLPVYHCLWNEPEECADIRQIVVRALFVPVSYTHLNVSVVSDTTVLIRFQIVVAIDSLHLIAVANVTTEKRGIKIRSVLIIIVASAIQIINIKAESQLLVYID